MLDTITETKNDFFEHLGKGKVLKLNEMNMQTSDEDFHQYHRILQSWHKQLTQLTFLPQHEDNLEEISIHSPTHIEYRYGHYKTSNDSDLTQEDLEASFDILALEHKKDWNYLHPFASFQGIYRSFPVRFTLIHHSASPEGKSKLFIRMLNKSIYPISGYTKNEIFFFQAITNKKNFLIAGSTGSGKTTFTNSLINMIADQEHIAIIEDTKELISKNKNTTFLITDPTNENKSMKSYLSYSLRISPDRIILGELRSDEVESALLAMNTGHNGFISTIHANSAKDSIHRIALLFKLYAKHDLDYNLILKLITANIDYIVFLENKKITEVIEVFGCEGEQIFYDHVI